MINLITFYIKSVSILIYHLYHSRTLAKPRLASHTSKDRLVFKDPGVHSSDDEEDGCEVGSEDGTSSNSSSHKHTSFDRHLVLVGRFRV